MIERLCKLSYPTAAARAAVKWNCTVNNAKKRLGEAVQKDWLVSFKGLYAPTQEKNNDVK